MKKWLISILVCAWLAGSIQNAYSLDDDDFQYWSLNEISKKLSQVSKVVLSQELYLGDNAGRLYYHHTDIGLVYSGLASWFELGLNYRQIYSQSNFKWYEENRPHINGTVKWKLYGFEMSDRSRFEYRIRELGDQRWRYRNRLNIYFPWKFSKYQIQPVIADDIFYDLDEGALTGNEFWAGLQSKITKNISVGLFYVRPDNRVNRNKWKNYHTLATVVKISL